MYFTPKYLFEALLDLSAKTLETPTILAAQAPYPEVGVATSQIYCI